MKKVLLIVLAVILAFSLVGCGKSTEEAAPTETAAPSADAEGMIELDDSASAEPEESAAVVTDRTVSPTTGLAGNTEYRPIIVQIDNEATGRPQYGIQQADIVYECMIEGADTRLTALFNDNLPEKVGPVRSARVYHQLLASEWDAIFIHDGGPYVAGFTKSYIYAYENGDTFQVRIDGTKRQADDILWQESVGIAYANVAKAEEKYNYARTERNPLFAFDENVSYADAQEITKVNIPFISKIDHYSYEYDSATGKLLRYRYGEPFDDAEEGQVSVQNLIIEYVSREELPNEGGRIVLGVLGSGEAEFIIDGKYLHGTWQKDGVKEPTIYKLDSGEEITLKPGNTWIELQPDNKRAVVTFADGTTNENASAAKKTTNDD